MSLFYNYKCHFENSSHFLRITMIKLPQLHKLLQNVAGVHQWHTSTFVFFDIAYKKGQLSLTNPRDACEMFAQFM